MVKILELIASCAFINSASVQTIACDYVKSNARSNNIFNVLGGFDSPAKVLDYDDGYVVYDCEILKAAYTNQSNLYIVHTSTAFTPGYVARANNNQSYKNYLLKSGYVHLTLEQVNQDGKTGGTIYPKNMWPKASDFTTTISSSVSYGSTIGKSFSGELSLGDGGKISCGDSTNSALTFSFTKSMSTISDDPFVSTQLSSDSVNEAQWNFEVINRDLAGKATYAFDQYFMFEMKTDANNCNEDAFILKYSVKFQGQYQGFFWAWYDGWEFTNTVNISCFL